MQSSSYQDQWVNVSGLKIRYLSNSLPKLNKPVVLLHGYSFNADDWASIGTLGKLNENGISFHAIDMPSGKKSKSQRHSNGNKYSASNFLNSIFEKLNISRATVVGPSMGGNFAISFAMDYPEKLSGLVLIAPAYERKRSNTDENSISATLQNIPTLIVWGENDNLIDVSEGKRLHSLIPNSQFRVIKGAGHACYLDSSDEFHKLFLDFVVEHAR